ncbi:MAG: hypothetical protein ACKPKO_06975, partial [Candidatus Fonsibacter sp.]
FLERRTHLSRVNNRGSCLAAGMAVHWNLIKSGIGGSTNGGGKMALMASLSTIRNMIDNGVAPIKLDQP